MSKLLQRQIEFARKMAILKYWMINRGIQWKEGRALCCEGCSKPTSLHRMSLAQDILLFKDGAYLTDTEDYRELGERWEEIGGMWGGRWNDGNHFSLSWGGYK